MANNNSNNVIIITIIIIITVSVTVVVGFPLSVCASALVCVYERYCQDGECKESVAYFCAGMHTKQLKRNKTKRSETKQSHYWPSKTATQAHERQRASTGKRGNANLRALVCEERNSEKWWVCTARKLTAPKRKKHSGNETGLSAGHKLLAHTRKRLALSVARSRRSWCLAHLLQCFSWLLDARSVIRTT